MSPRTQKIIAAIVVIAAFAVGRYSAPVKIKTETKIVEVEKKTDETQTDKDRHKKITIVEVTKPDGTKEKTTTITDDTSTKSTTTTTDTVAKSETDTKEVTRRGDLITLSALGGLDVHNLGQPVWGAAVSRSLIGPLSIGAWGFNNGTGGLSVGLSF